MNDQFAFDDPVQRYGRVDPPSHVSGETLDVDGATPVP